MNERITRLVLPRRTVLAGGAAIAGALIMRPAQAQVAEGVRVAQAVKGVQPGRQARRSVC